MKTLMTLEECAQAANSTALIECDQAVNLNELEDCSLVADSIAPEGCDQAVNPNYSEEHSWKASLNLHWKPGYKALGKAKVKKQEKQELHPMLWTWS